MRTLFIVLSSISTVVAILPYIIDTVKGRTKPRIVSWFNWTILATIAAAASYSDHQYAAAIMSTCSAVECLSIVILGFHRGEKGFIAFDIACQIAAGVGLILWWIYNSPAIAVMAAVTIDLIASLPTIKHAWEKPKEETWSTFFLSGLGAAFTILAVTEYKITSFANPLYILLINALLTAIILSRRRVITHAR